MTERLVRLLSFLACSAALYPALAFAEEHDRRAPQPPTPDEALLLELRSQFHREQADGGRAWFDDAPASKQVEWFKNGLRQAAVHEGRQSQPQPDEANGLTSRVPRPHFHPEPPEWKVLLEAAMNLERVAHELDHKRLWNAADEVRRSAASLRSMARQAALPQPHNPTRPDDRLGP